MLRLLKILTIVGFAIAAFTACFNSGADRFVIAESPSYEASLFRQHCAICHGTEADGKVLVDGTIVPSLRTGEFKTRTAAEIHAQIQNGGNGMLPFRDSLTAREIDLLSEFVERDLRGH